MSDETIEVTNDLAPPAEAQTAPTEQEETPSPDTDTTAESAEEKKPSRAEQRIQQLVGERNNYKDFATIAERERDYYKQQLEAAKPTPEPEAPLVAPKMEDFDHDPELWAAEMARYNAKVIDQKVEAGVSQALQSNQQQAAAAQVDAEWAKNVDSFAVDNPDFHEVAFATKDIFDVIKAASDGPQIAYWLGQNPGEAQRIGSLPKSALAFELGRIPVNQAQPKTAKSKQSQAPEPIKPVGSTQPVTVPANESIEDFMRRRNEEQRQRRGR